MSARHGPRTCSATGAAIGAGACLLMLVLGTSSALPASPQGPSLQLAQEPERERPRGMAFGFGPGEERRYLLGPPDSLAAGEGAEWWIRLDGVDGEGAAEVAEFSFGHERTELIGGTWNPAESLLQVVVEGSLRVNLAGFPLEARFEQRFVQQGERTSSGATRRLTYTYRDGRYEKLLQVGSQDWDFDFAVPEFKNVDLDVPRGVILWMPSSLACLGSSQSTCVERDPAFSNPGFLSLAMPELFEQIDSEGDDEREFAFFTPTSLSASPFLPVTTGRWVSSERNNFANRDRYFARWKVKIGASEDVEVGPRTLHAWELDMGGGIDRIYVEPSGRVVRVDLESTLDNADDRYIRLVFPFEEFTSPNADPALRRR